MADNPKIRAGRDSIGIPIEILRTGARALGIDLSDKQIRQFALFADLLVQWNRRMNLTRITEPLEIVTRHFLDSLTCLAAAQFRIGARIIDVGTGPGMPGVPLKIARPDISLVLLDSVGKKLAFLQTAMQEIGIYDAMTVHARAEDAGHDPEHREAYDIVTARALGKMPQLVELCLPFAAMGGHLLAMKAQEVDAEVGSAGRSISLLGGRIERVVTLTVPHTSLVRNIVVIEKVKPTPQKYPRSPAQIEKSPL